jgi:DNA-binding NarL/FixJ family response regulator
MIRLLLADDHPIVREGLKRMLSDQRGIEVAAEATQGSEVVAALRQAPFDIVLLDLSMPGRSGIDLVRQIRSEYPKVPILVLTMHQEEQYAVRAIRAGARGYLTKGIGAAELVAAIVKVAGGGVVVSPRVAELLAMEAMPNADPLPHQALSDREFQVFRLLVEGRGVSEIAAQLFLSVKTVSTHKTHILQKMSLASVPDLVRYAMRHRLLDDASETAE